MRTSLISIARSPVDATAVSIRFEAHLVCLSYLIRYVGDFLVGKCGHIKSCLTVNVYRLRPRLVSSYSTITLIPALRESV